MTAGGDIVNFGMTWGGVGFEVGKVKLRFDDILVAVLQLEHDHFEYQYHSAYSAWWGRSQLVLRNYVLNFPY
jgi:hypothetical protein